MGTCKHDWEDNYKECPHCGRNMEVIVCLICGEEKEEKD